MKKSEKAIALGKIHNFGWNQSTTLYEVWTSLSKIYPEWGLSEEMPESKLWVLIDKELNKRGVLSI